MATGKKIWEVEDNNQVEHYVDYSPNGNWIVNSNRNLIIIRDAFTGNEIKTFNGQQHSLINSIHFSADGKYIVSGCSNLWGQNTVNLWDINTGTEVIKFPGNNKGITSVALSNDNKHIVSGDRGGMVKIWDVSAGTLLRTFSGHKEEITSVAFYNNNKFVISTSYDCTVRIWNIETGDWVELITDTDPNRWFIRTSDNYWDASSDGGELVTMVKGLEYWNIDQFAVRNNRPDIILQRLGSGNKELIDHYYQQYKKRLRKLGLTEELLSSELHIPTATIVNTKQDGNFVTINFKVSDEKYNLKQYNVYLNDVPIFGAYGKSISGQSQTISERIELTTGDNKIEISCMNAKGAKSYRALTYAPYNEPIKGNLYYLAFGVSKYQDDKMNLQFADKDALDLEKVMQGCKGKGFENVYTKVLTNEQVTPDAIKAAKDFVKNAKPGDTFVLFIAGHGMHDKDAEATYYFLTSNADMYNLKATAADFETIEDLLQGIPPRNKLFLMDACESGEIDEETYETLTGSQTLAGLGIASRGFKATSATSTINAQPSAKRTYLYQKDRYIYNDLVRRSGAIVFSSSKGGELSYERSDIENGLFTEYIMRAFTTTETDKDNNGIVSTDELRQYVSDQVAKASGDLQHPTVDRDNIYQKFGFPLKYSY